MLISFRVGDEHVIGTDVNFIVLVPVLLEQISEATFCKYSRDYVYNFTEIYSIKCFPVNFVDFSEQLFNLITHNVTKWLNIHLKSTKSVFDHFSILYVKGSGIPLKTYFRNFTFYGNFEYLFINWVAFLILEKKINTEEI